nr:MAG TPA: hypothetical protein [Caudoviricetes sp.]
MKGYSFELPWLFSPVPSTRSPLSPGSSGMY